MNYLEFISTKEKLHIPTGVTNPVSCHHSLFDFQCDVTQWAASKGRCAIFLDTGLGKSRISIDLARIIMADTGGKALIIAPLSITKQTIREALSIGVDVVYSNDGLSKGPITITNYEHSHKFNPNDFDIVMLDESSILKSQDGKFRKRLTDQWSNTRFRYCFTATPAPNDIAEIGFHAEFLGVMKQSEMLATFFVHDSNSSQDWRLKKHAEEPFYKWLASWGITMRRPSDLGYADDGYILPPLSVTPVFIDSQWKPDGALFADKIRGLTDRIKIRKNTVNDKVAKTAEIVNSISGQWIVWGGLNPETDALHKLIPGSVNVQGSDSPEFKADTFESFQNGNIRVLISKVSIAGFGMNFQSCNRMVFCGINDSYESFYQAIRRCYRFGQNRPVDVRVVITEPEDAIFQNVLSKEREADNMRSKLIDCIRNYELEELNQFSRTNTYVANQDVILPTFMRKYESYSTVSK